MATLTALTTAALLGAGAIPAHADQPADPRIEVSCAGAGAGAFWLGPGAVLRTSDNEPAAAVLTVETSDADSLTGAATGSQVTWRAFGVRAGTTADTWCAGSTVVANGASRTAVRRYVVSALARTQPTPAAGA